MRTDDGYMVYRCLNGDSSAFGFLVDKYREGVYALAYSRLRNFHDAQDVAQEVFVRAYENLHKLRRWESFASWLYRIALSLCSRWVRSQSRRPDREFMEDQEPGMFEDHSMDSYRESLMYESLHEALDSLAEIHREVLMLHYFGGMTSSEIGRFTGVSPAAVRKRLARARSLLKDEMLDTMQEVFEEQELPAGFTLRILEMVKHIRVQPLPRLAELGWGLSVALGIMIAVLGSGSFIKLERPPDFYVESAVPAATGSTGVGEIPVIIFEQTSEREGDTSMLNHKKISAAAVFAAMLGILSGNALAQTEWTKYEMNPVLKVGPEAWDGQNIFDSAVLIDEAAPIEQKFKMWYGGHDGYNFRIGYATSPDGINWTKHGKVKTLKNGVPVDDGLLGPSGAWDDLAVLVSCVISHDSEYRMWYTGGDDYSNPTSRIGYATSPDGINWTKYNDPTTTDLYYAESDPVLDVGPPGAWDEDRVNSPTVIFDGTKYNMWYSVVWDSGQGIYEKIGYASSPDGIHWTKYDDPNTTGPFSQSDPVLGGGPTGAWDELWVTIPCVLFHQGEYRMWYSGYPKGGSYPPVLIGYATSPDGIVWTKYDDPATTDPLYAESDPVLHNGLTGVWDDAGVYRPRVVVEGNVYKMWYTGDRHGYQTGVDYPHQIGYATAPMGNVYIDIKPGSYPNSVNLGSSGVVPVAILSFGDFDATIVDPESVSLSGADVAVRGKGNKLLAHQEDVNGDGLLDLVMQVETENLDPGAFQDGYAVLTGETYDSQTIEGWDEINIVPVDGDAAPADSTGSEALAVFPQPANPDLWIPYKLAQDVDVTITIHNISGRVVRTLNLGHQPAGLYVSRDKAAHWDGRNEAGEQVSSGIYFYTIQAGEFTATQKMIIAR